MGAFANRCVIALAAVDNSTANSTAMATETATSSSASSTATGSSSGAAQRATLSDGLAACVVMVLAGMVMLG
jgi:hypothetical protein